MNNILVCHATIQRTSFHPRSLMHRRTTSRFDRDRDVSTQISGPGTAAFDAALPVAAGDLLLATSRQARALELASRDAASRAAVDDANVRCGGALQCRGLLSRLLRFHESIFCDT